MNEITQAIENDSISKMKSLLKNGADLNKVNQREQTPLEGVCFKGYIEIVKLLVQSGARITNNSINFASIFGHKEIVKYLKENADLKEHKILGVDVESISNFVAKIKSFFRKN